MPDTLSFEARLAQSGLVVDPQTGRLPIRLGDALFEIEVHETPAGCLLRCDVDCPGAGLVNYAQPLSQLASAEPGTTEVLVANNRLTVIRHLSDTTPHDLRSAVQRLVGLTQMTGDIVAMLRTADEAEQRIASAPGGKFPDLQPALAALAALPNAGAALDAPSASVPSETVSVAAPTPTVSRRQGPYGFIGLWINWTLATAMAFGLSYYVGTVLKVPSLLVSLALSWAFVALFQAGVMRRVFSRYLLWVPVTLIGGVLGDYFANSLAATAKSPLMFWALFIVGGGLTGLVQCLYLRKRVAGVLWWVAANLAAPVLQLLILLHLPATLFPSAPDAINIASTGAVSGLALGLVTGLTLALIRAPDPGAAYEKLVKPLNGATGALSAALRAQPPDNASIRAASSTVSTALNSFGTGLSALEARVPGSIKQDIEKLRQSVARREADLRVVATANDSEIGVAIQRFLSDVRADAPLTALVRNELGLPPNAEI